MTRGSSQRSFCIRARIQSLALAGQISRHVTIGISWDEDFTTDVSSFPYKMALQDEWRWIPRETIRRLIASLPEVVAPAWMVSGQDITMTIEFHTFLSLHSISKYIWELPYILFLIYLIRSNSEVTIYFLDVHFTDFTLCVRVCACARVCVLYNASLSNMRPAIFQLHDGGL